MAESHRMREGIEIALVSAVSMEMFSLTSKVNLDGENGLV